jgi:hypothetical protein
MREPVFNETLQLGIVVRDLEATMRRYVDDYGVGPWEVYEFDAGKAEISASTVSRSNGPGALLSPRSATCSGGLSSHSTTRGSTRVVLAEKGEGVHHVAVATPDAQQQNLGR